MIFLNMPLSRAPDEMLLHSPKILPRAADLGQEGTGIQSIEEDGVARERAQGGDKIEERIGALARLLPVITLQYTLLPVLRKVRPE